VELIEFNKTNYRMCWELVIKNPSEFVEKSYVRVDGLIKDWSLQSDAWKRLTGHSDYVFTLILLGNGKVAIIAKETLERVPWKNCIDRATMEQIN